MADGFDKWFISLVTEVLRKSGRESSDPEELPKRVEETISRVLPEAADLLLKAMKSTSPKMLKEKRAFTRHFEARLFRKWRKPIDLLQMLLEICLEEGSEFNRQHREEASKINDYVFDVLTRLHGRACQIGFEILALLKSGLADGAYARSRTLYEIVVVAFFIREHGQDVAKRYLQYEIIETYREALEYQKYCRELGYEPLREKELEQIREMRDNILKAYGKDFKKNYGWVPIDKLRERTFAEIEKSVNLEKYRPYYKMACNEVHAGTKGIRFRLGLIHDSTMREIILAAPSNYGLADPGQEMAISLMQITSCLMSTRPSMKRLITIMAMQKLAHEIGLAFVEVQSQIEKEEKNRP